MLAHEPNIDSLKWHSINQMLLPTRFAEIYEKMIAFSVRKMDSVGCRLQHSLNNKQLAKGQDLFITIYRIMAVSGLHQDDRLVNNKITFIITLERLKRIQIKECLIKS